MNKQHDLAIRWNDHTGEMSRIRRKGGIEVYGRPLHLKLPGGKVMVVTKGGVVKLVFTAVALDGPKMVWLSNGNQRKGYVIRAKRGSFHKPRNGEPDTLTKRWYAIGQYRYIEAKTAKAMLTGPVVSGEGSYLEDEAQALGYTLFHPFRGVIPGYPQNYPEAKLVSQYLAWLRDTEGFGQNYIREARLFVDLFDRRKWRLIEAKASADRGHIRMAVGQLLDYRRFYAKSPSLGVLLPERPTAACLTYLRENRITAVWRTSSGRFNDSTEMHSWTLERRRSIPPVS